MVEGSPPPGSMVDFAGGEQTIENPFCRRRTSLPLRLGDYWRTADLQAKMIPLGAFHPRRKVLQA